MADDLWLSSSSSSGADNVDDILAMMGGGSLPAPLAAPAKKAASAKPAKTAAAPAAPQPAAGAVAEHAAETGKSPFTVVRKVKRKAEDGVSCSSGSGSSGGPVVARSTKMGSSMPAPAPAPPAAPAAPAPAPAAPAPAPAPPPKEKHRSLTAVEDPMQYHAKPKDLSQNALKRPREEAETGAGTGTGAVAAGGRPLKKSSAQRAGDGGGGDKKTATFARAEFGSLGLQRKLVEHLEQAKDRGGFGLARSTGVQSAVLPLLLSPSSSSPSSRHNLLIKSQTGSGKTLAYLVPIVNDLMTLQPPVQRGDGTRAVVIAPTRELCSQIADVLERLTQCCVNVVGGSITGGEKKKSEKARLRKGIVVLVGTPGRLLDHLKTTESFTLSRLRWVVLDEADRLLDMGFEQSILEILSLVRGERLPGLRAPNERDQAKAARTAAGSLPQRWAQQTAQKAKVCDATEDIVHLMASATLTWGVRQLAGPVMGGAGFAVVDADQESVVMVESAEDLLQMREGPGGGDKQKAAARVMTVEDGVVSFGDDREGIKADDNDEEEGGSKSATGAGGSSSKASTALLKGEAMDAPQQLAQYYMLVTCKWRLAALVCFLRAHVHQKVVVFCTTCDSVDFHALLLREADWPLELDPGVEQQGSGGGDDQSASDSAAAAAAANMTQTLEPLAAQCTGMLGRKCSLFRLHGSMPQQARQTVFREFSAARSGVLLCTDVAARGLDLPHVDWILQYDPPCETADYVHRVGRTARSGLGGSALLFLLPSEANYTQLLASHRLYPEALSLQSLFQDTAQHIPGAVKFKNTDEMTAVILQRRLETVVHGNRPLLGAARQTFRSFVRAYATHSSDTKGIFSVQALHLGHVAKSFALRESPKQLRAADDIMARINNGHFTATRGGGGGGGGAGGAGGAGGGKMTRQARDERYALSAGGGFRGGSSGGGGGGGKKQDKDRQKARKMGGGSSKGGAMAPSGKFRKSGGGYFRSKLRKQANSEFSQ